MTVPAGTDLLRQLHETSTNVDRASDELYGLITELKGGVDATTGEVTAGVATEYEAAYDREIIAIEERALASGQRIPAQDLRAARARMAIRENYPGLYLAFIEKTARVEALGKWIAAKKAVISGLQSVLRGERE
jgi:hypothetical protein